jgi:hypothetical protein
VVSDQDLGDRSEEARQRMTSLKRSGRGGRGVSRMATVPDHRNWAHLVRGRSDQVNATMSPGNMTWYTVP